MNVKYYNSTEFTLKTEEEKQKFQRLYELYASDMYRVANSILKDPYLAQDAVHDCFLMLVHHLHKLQEEDIYKTKGFLLKMTKNLACTMKHHSQKENPYEAIEELLPDETKTPELTIVEDDTKQYLVQQLAHLKKRDQEILECIYLRGMQTEEAAQLLQLSPANVRKRLQRARETLRKRLRRKGLIE